MGYLCNKGVYGKGVIIGIGALITKSTVEVTLSKLEKERSLEGGPREGFAALYRLQV